MFRIICVLLIVLAWYHGAYFIEQLYRARNDYLKQKAKMTEMDRTSLNKIALLKASIRASREKVLVHHFIWGGPFLWIIIVPVYWLWLRK